MVDRPIERLRRAGYCKLTFYKQPPSAEKAMSYTSLCKWLETEEGTGVITRFSAERLSSHSKIFNQLTSIDSHRPFLGLEYHHDSENELDVSLKGGYELFELKDIEYPQWLLDLAGRVENNLIATNPVEEVFYVEFDQGSEGFSLAGFFKRFFTQGGDGEALNADPVMGCLELFDKFRGCDSKSSSCLAEFLNEIGVPSWVGFMSRGGNVVKLVAHLNEININRAGQLCAKYFANIFDANFISIASTFDEIKASLTHSAIRLSLDLDLDRDIFLPRFSLEVATRTYGKEAKEWPLSVTRLMDCLQISKSAASDFKRIFNMLPKGIKRPSNPITADLEILYCQYNHLKISVTSNATTIKSYISANHLLDQRSVEHQKQLNNSIE